MNKTWLIIKREYLTRVKNKTFLLSTFLTPLLLVGIMVAVVALTVKSAKQEKVAVVDRENLLKDYLENAENIQYEFIPDADTSWLSKGYTALLIAPYNSNNKTGRFQIVSTKNLNVISEGAISKQVNAAMEARLIAAGGGLSKSAYDSLRQQARDVGVDNMVLTADASLKKGNSGVAYGVGYGAAFLIYITLFLYGAMVMRSVMEEKTNRIAEVVVSSVRPTQLMMGKIIGVGAVGVTQFVLWIILISSLSWLVGLIFPADALAQANQVNGGLPAGGMAGQTNAAVSSIAKARAALGTVNWVLIIGCFLFYFIFGYLFYAALFAAVGSAVNEDPQDAQSLMVPITMPIILAIIIMINAIAQPESSLATWSSIIPFFSPIVMMARIPFGVPGTVPWWQLGLSMFLLVAGFWATTWASAKIYRTAILLYGKKITLKELWKWAIRKG